MELQKPVTTLSLLIAVLQLNAGSREWRIRDRAASALYRLTPYSLPHLSLGCKSSNAELASRCKRMTEKWRAENAAYLAPWVKRKYGKLPWLYREGYFHDYYVRTAVNQGCKNVGPDWTAWRYATWLWIIDQYSSGVTTKQILRELNKMVLAETQYRKANPE